VQGVPLRRYFILCVITLTVAAARCQTAAPAFAPAAGTYTMPISVTLTDSSPSPTIKWCFHSGTTTCTPATTYTGSIYLCPASPSACPVTGQAETLCSFATSGGINSATVCATYVTGNPNLATGDGRGAVAEPAFPLTTSCTTVAATLFLVKTTTLNVDPLNPTISTPKHLGGSGGTSLEPFSCTGTYNSVTNICTGGTSANVETDDTRVQTAINAAPPCVELTMGTSGQNVFVLGQWHPITGVPVVIDVGVDIDASRNPADYGGGNCGTISASGNTSCTDHWIYPTGSSNSGIYGYGRLNGRCWDRSWTGSANGAVTTGWCYNRVSTYAWNHSNSWAGITPLSAPSGWNPSNGYVAYGPDVIHWRNSTNNTFYKLNIDGCMNFCFYWGDGNGSTTGNGLTGWGLNILSATEVSNSDGFDPSYAAQNVTLNSSNVSTGDNAVAMKSDNGTGHTAGITQNISLLNNQTSGIGVYAGTDIQGGFNNVLVSNLVQRGSPNNPSEQEGIGIDGASTGGNVSLFTWQNICQYALATSVKIQNAETSTSSPSTFTGLSILNLRTLNNGTGTNPGSGEYEFEGSNSSNTFTAALSGAQADGNITSGAYKYGTINLGPNNVSSTLTSRLSGTGLTVNNSITNPSSTPYSCTATTATTLGSWLPLWGNLSMSYGGNHNLQGYTSALSSLTFTLQAVLMPSAEVNTAESQALTQPVQFYDNGSPIGSPVALGSNGTLATMSVTATTGVHNYTAKYPGDSNYPAYTFGNPGTGNVLTVNVNGGALPPPAGFGVFVSGP
jgi:hypothetical protein